MKYIKLFEDFSDKVLDNLEDIKWIIVSFCDDKISYKLLTNYEDKLIVYSLSFEQTNLEEFESLQGRIKDLNPKYEYVVVEGKIAIGLPEYLKVFENIEMYKIRNYTFNDDFSIDVNGDVDLSYRGLTKITIVFRNVTGDFDCSSNKLTSLEGCPETIEGSFHCDNNNLKSLKGGPKKVGGDFDCRFDNLTSLVGGPETVGGNFDCSYNDLTSLEGSPETIEGSFECSNNNLISLLGSPETVVGDFDCYDNRLKSLEGISDVKGSINSDF